MIITKLIGGLGNQMFQYATGRRLGYKLGVELKLDISAFDEYRLRGYDLGAFNIQENIATAQEVQKLTQRKKSLFNRLVRRVLRREPKLPTSYVKEKHFHFDPCILNASDGVYLDGYWQSEKYFIDIDQIIREDFTLKKEQVGKDKEIGGNISSCESVSLHIRRGDFVSNARTSTIHGTCNLNYYYRCVEEITKNVKNPHFFIFTDDTGWVSKNVKLSYPATVIDHNGRKKSYEDLMLMSLCSHNIIANSSFSWWGAWLNRNPNKMVFAPLRWFAKDDISTRDLIPEKWRRI